MDAHYDQVMRAREKADPAPRLYFAYSTTLDAEAFETWRGQHGYERFVLPEGRLAQAVDTAVVFDFPSRFWGGRVAGLASKPGSIVWGKVFEIAGVDWPIIQHKEGVVTGMSVEMQLSVEIDGQRCVATAFATNPARVSEEGALSQQFLEAWRRGAVAAGLPPSWIASIAAP
jgi:gamma-glutamylcyclotransferase